MLAQVIPMQRPEALSGSREDWKVPVFERLNAWLDGIERRGSMDKLIDITSTLLDNRDELLGELVLAVIRRRYKGLIEQKTCPCPHCKRSLKVRARHRRRVKTLAGSFALEPPCFYCKKCDICRKALSTLCRAHLIQNVRLLIVHAIGCNA